MTKEDMVLKVTQLFEERFIIKEKKKLFTDTMIDYLLKQKSGIIRLMVDYDPQDELLQLLHKCDIPCSGCMFSARGIFQGTKFGAIINFDTKTFGLKTGYGELGEPQKWR